VSFTDYGTIVFRHFRHCVVCRVITGLEFVDRFGVFKI